MKTAILNIFTSGSKEKSNPIRNKKIIFLNVSCLLGIIIEIFFAVRYFFVGQQLIGFIVDVGAIIVFTIIFVIMRVKMHLVIISNIFIILCFMLFIYLGLGGDEKNSAFAWIPVFAIIAIYVAGILYGAIYSIFYISLVSYFIFFKDVHPYISDGFKMRLVFVYMVITILAIIYEFFLNNAVLSINKSKEKIEEYSSQLEKLDDMKNDFIANITHDLRSPLTGILGLSEISMMKTEDDWQKENFELIFQASLKLAGLIDRLLDLARMDSSNIQLDIQKIDLIKFIDEILKLYKSKLYGEKISIINTIKGEDDFDFYSDIVKLEQIITNLLSNAIKFANIDHGVVTLSVVDTKNSFQIIVKDNGIGINKDKLQTIFKRFEQIHGGRNSLYKGSGIGLAFVKQLTTILGGKVWAESEGEGTGSSFIIEFKKGKDYFNKNANFISENDNDLFLNRRDSETSVLQTLDLNQNQKKPLIEIKDMNKKSITSLEDCLILIVDDDHLVTTIVKSYLNDFGYKNFITCYNGEQGVEVVKKYHPHIIICDYNMPVMDGAQFLDELANNSELSKIPFLFLTALADNKSRLILRKKGALEFLVKPIVSEELKIAVNQALKIRMDYLFKHSD